MMMKMKGFLLSSIFWNGSRTHLETAPKSRVVAFQAMKTFPAETWF